MKKFNFILIFVMFLILSPIVKALDVSTEFIGDDVINEGYSTILYVKVDTKTSFDKIDICYKPFGNIEIEDVNAMGGMTISNKYSRRAIITSENLIPSGTVVFAFTLKGVKPGEGSLKITSIDVYNGDELITGVAKIHDFVINPAKTDEELLDELNQSALNKSMILVEASEKSLNEEDYTVAKEAVDALIASQTKNSLQDRLNEVRFNIEVNKKCSTDIVVKEPVKTSNSKPWILLCACLSIALIGETVYLIIKSKNNY